MLLHLDIKILWKISGRSKTEIRALTEQGVNLLRQVHVLSKYSVIKTA